MAERRYSMVPRNGWAAISHFGFLVPGVWGKPADGLAIYRSKECAQEQARADAHSEYPTRVVRVRITEAPRRKAKRKGGRRP